MDKQQGQKVQELNDKLEDQTYHKNDQQIDQQDQNDIFQQQINISSQSNEEKSILTKAQDKQDNQFQMNSQKQDIGDDNIESNQRIENEVFQSENHNSSQQHQVQDIEADFIDQNNNQIDSNLIDNQEENNDQDERENNIEELNMNNEDDQGDNPQNPEQVYFRMIGAMNNEPFLNEETLIGFYELLHLNTPEMFDEIDRNLTDWKQQIESILKKRLEIYQKKVELISSIYQQNIPNNSMHNIEKIMSIIKSKEKEIYIYKIQKPVFCYHQFHNNDQQAQHEQNEQDMQMQNLISKNKSKDDEFSKEQYNIEQHENEQQEQNQINENQNLKFDQLDQNQIEQTNKSQVTNTDIDNLDNMQQQFQSEEQGLNLNDQQAEEQKDDEIQDEYTEENLEKLKQKLGQNEQIRINQEEQKRKLIEENQRLKKEYQLMVERNQKLKNDYQQQVRIENYLLRNHAAQQIQALASQALLQQYEQNQQVFSNQQLLQENQSSNLTRNNQQSSEDSQQNYNEQQQNNHENISIQQNTINHISQDQQIINNSQPQNTNNYCTVNNQYSQQNESYQEDNQNNQINNRNEENKQQENQNNPNRRNENNHEEHNIRQQEDIKCKQNINQQDNNNNQDQQNISHDETNINNQQNHYRQHNHNQIQNNQQFGNQNIQMQMPGKNFSINDIQSILSMQFVDLQRLKQLNPVDNSITFEMNDNYLIKIKSSEQVKFDKTSLCSKIPHFIFKDHIFTFLSSVELFKVRSVSPEWREMVREVWHKTFKRDMQEQILASDICKEIEVQVKLMHIRNPFFQKLSMLIRAMVEVINWDDFEKMCIENQLSPLQKKVVVSLLRILGYNLFDYEHINQFEETEFDRTHIEVAQHLKEYLSTSVRHNGLSSQELKYIYNNFLSQADIQISMFRNDSQKNFIIFILIAKQYFLYSLLRNYITCSSQYMQYAKNKLDCLSKSWHPSKGFLEGAYRILLLRNVKIKNGQIVTHDSDDETEQLKVLKKTKKTHRVKKINQSKNSDLQYSEQTSQQTHVKTSEEQCLQINELKEQLMQDHKEEQILNDNQSQEQIANEQQSISISQQQQINNDEEQNQQQQQEKTNQLTNENINQINSEQNNNKCSINDQKEESEYENEESEDEDGEKQSQKELSQLMKSIFNLQKSDSSEPDIVIKRKTGLMKIFLDQGTKLDIILNTVLSVNMQRMQRDVQQEAQELVENTKKTLENLEQQFHENKSKIDEMKKKSQDLEDFLIQKQEQLEEARRQKQILEEEVIQETQNTEGIDKGQLDDLQNDEEIAQNNNNDEQNDIYNQDKNIQ